MRITLPSGWTDGEFATTGSRLPYVRTGGPGKPPVVLVHGFNDSGLGWTRVARELAETYDVLLPDNRAHGRHTVTNDTFTTTDMADDLAELIRHLGLPPVLLVGHSMGGFVVADLAAKYPELVGRLVLVDPPYGMATRLGGTRPLVGLLVFSRWWARPLTYNGVRRAFRVLYRSWTDEERDTMAQALVESMPHRTPGVHLFERRRDWLGLLATIKPPTLLLTSTKGLIKPAERDQILAALPNGVGITVPAAAHNIQRDNYPAFMTALLDFAARESVA